MVWVTATATESILIAASKKDVFAAILDVVRMYDCVPGCELVEFVGGRDYRLVMRERRALGWVHRPDYRIRFADNGDDQIWFEPAGGNFEKRGRWYLSETTAGPVRVSHTVTGVLEAALPRILSRPATLFARKDIRAAIRSQLRHLKTGLEVRMPLATTTAY